MSVGTFSVLQVVFLLQRHTGYFLIQVHFNYNYNYNYNVKYIEHRHLFLPGACPILTKSIGECSFLRKFNFFLKKVYVPCTLIVILSWVGFWLNRWKIISHHFFEIFNIFWVQATIWCLNSGRQRVIESLWVWPQFWPCLPFLLIADQIFLRHVSLFC